LKNTPIVPLRISNPEIEDFFSQGDHGAALAAINNGLVHGTGLKGDARIERHQFGIDAVFDPDRVSHRGL